MLISNMYNFIIVGQGIAGSVLAAHLLQLNQKILVIDNGHKSASTLAAAGLWNPIVFRKIGKSYMADNLVPYLYTFYQKQEENLKASFFHPITIARVFADENQKNAWLQLTQEKEFEHFVGEFVDKLSSPENIIAKNGIGKVKQSGWLNTDVFLNEFKEHLKKQDAYLQDDFSPESLKIEENGIIYKQYKAEKIIFCEGYKVRENPWFNWVPIAQTKGQTLTVKANLNLKEVLNYGNFILPLNTKNQFRIGATFEWDKTEANLTEEAKSKLLEGTKKVLDNPHFEVINQRAGFRPTVKDRRPVIGVHPKYKNMLIFNGMGAKGVMLAPWFALNFCNFLFKGEPIWDTANVERFYPLFNTSDAENHD
jgi:glycine/D-amino acid oxidase-like deaminating enzyme